MSFLKKLQFWKKKEDNLPIDFSLPPSDSTPSAFANTNTSNQEFKPQKYDVAQDPYMPQDPLQQSQNQQGNLQDSNNDQFSSTTSQTNTFQEQNPFQTFDKNDMSEQEYGRKLAQKYAAQQETIHTKMQENSTSQQPSPQSEELFHLKLDAMKSEISLVNQRLQKIEHLLEAQIKQRGRY
ncbi:MAG: hypothetical protein ACOCQQ_00895 [Candidatus Nanoarchaeia archaeon]